MENKTTTELLDLYKTLMDEEGNILNQDEYDAWWEEIKQREPFFQIINEDWEDSLPVLKEKIENIQDDIDLLKRHKHEEKTDDVMIRI
ncbi:hypothetical protein A2159_01305 [Candidatus Woesebacteria bacterium RBG_13_34_9]|uniref:Uncharacterized protein n=1 Tax=Candidatus Woesebacteria bacterium RBG_13_34_9 TaxID=1802477 RepID=A0A1F7X6L8_9BACT|nr:MAG: hypothetical protein A2159_01305 [Candidatus Woesebacteria bacterium RBG_13_34_9]